MLKDNFRPDRRRLHADSLLSLIIRTARKCKDDTAADPHLFEQELYDRLSAALNNHGAEIISDYDRQQYGLPPRGPDGWTDEEIIALEKKRLEALMNQPPISGEALLNSPATESAPRTEIS